MKKTILFVFLTSFQILYAQKLSDVYGIVGIDDIQYNSCEFDKAADAVVMYNYGSSKFIENINGGFDIIFERTTRIKILTDAGVKWGEIEIPYYQSNNIFERIYEIDATTYNFEDGQLNRTKLNTNNSHDEKISEFWLMKKFALPNVKKGSIVEFTYKISSPYVFNLRDWEFQWEIPVLTSIYKVNLIPFYTYNFILQGASAFDIHTSETSNFDRAFGSTRFRDLTHTFGMKNIKAFNNEGYITSKNDYIMKLDFQLSKFTNIDGITQDVITTWPKLNEDMLKEDNFGKFLEKTVKMTPKILNPIGFVNMDQKQKFDSVMNYVKLNYTWDKKEGKYSSKKPTDILKDKFGNSADLNLFAVGLLNGLGVEAYPVLISTRNHGKIKADYPFLDFFDYTLLAAKIDSVYTLSDATDIMLSNNRIPISCINDKGLIVQKKKVEWISLQPHQTTILKTNLLIDLTDTLKNTDIILKAYEYDGLHMRKKYGTNLKEIQKKLVEDNYQVEDSDITIKNQNVYSNPYILGIKFNYIPEKVNNKIYVVPFLSEVIRDNPFKQKERTYPIDMVYPEYRSYVSTIKIPTGFKIDYVPENSKIKNDQFELEYYSTISDNSITFSFSYFFKKAEYQASEYLKLKFYYNEIINKGSDKVVFVKNN